jgi:hypothetical protein
MKAVFFIDREKYGGAKSKLYADEVVSRQSITVKESSALGKGSDGYYVQIDGDEKAIAKARELLGTSAKELKDREAEEVSSAIEGQESTAAEGFGAIFG